MRKTAYVIALVLLAMHINAQKYKELIEQAITKTESKDYKGALNDIELSIKINPNYSEAYARRAIVKDRQNNLNEAKLDYDLGIKLDNKNFFALFNRAVIKSAIKDYKGALVDYSGIINLNSSEQYVFTAYLGRGALYLTFGDKNKACQDFSKVKELGDDRWYKLHCQ